MATWLKWSQAVLLEANSYIAAAPSAAGGTLSAQHLPSLAVTISECKPYPLGLLSCSVSVHRGAKCPKDV